LLWRPLGWWRVRITVAGWYGEEANTQQHRNILLPVGTREDAWKALWLVLPELGLDDPTDLLDEAMFGNHKSARWFTPAPTRSWIFSPFQWRRRGFTHTSKVLVTRGGWLVRYFDVVPHERAQSLCVQQGPLQRLANLASVKAHVSTAYFHPMAKHMKVEDAEALVENETNLAAAARAVQTPEQWLAAVSA
jgi:putative membrane protein